MAVIKNYVCSVQADCNKTFTKYNDLKKHEAAHSPNAHICRFPGCDFATLSKASFEIHSDRHTGEQRYKCPHGCGYKTHNPAALTRHRKIEHGHLPLSRGGRTAATSASHMTPLSASQTMPQPQPQPQPQLQPQAQPQLLPQLQLQVQPQPQPQPPQQNNYNNMLGAFYGGPARPAANPWQPPAAPYSYQYHPSVGYFYGPTYPQNGYAGLANAGNGLNAGYMYPGYM
ncbi:uncharacterized protein HD556DRAFT_509222 [Suillus plorans]|uniref:C2H2-type domain-containing protein n=1 Tax=Suillus plorans TaxID=116603 RepID=A0A9P7DHZ0_9AGAM|nr:uncharacterized protein HD556DRAFT_509222 [Suillus plorans]KAG1793499.1 hypothetical protein HD556DRAFT_509222 [Suillus plorans]